MVVAFFQLITLQIACTTFPATVLNKHHLCKTSTFLRMNNFTHWTTPPFWSWLFGLFVFSDSRPTSNYLPCRIRISTKGNDWWLDCNYFTKNSVNCDTNTQWMITSEHIFPMAKQLKLTLMPRTRNPISSIRGYFFICCSRFSCEAYGS